MIMDTEANNVQAATRGPGSCEMSVIIAVWNIKSLHNNAEAQMHSEQKST